MDFYIYDEINTSIAKSFAKFVRDSPEIDHLNIYICSDGGSFECACSIIDIIRGLKRNSVEVNTFVDGMAYSAAAFIFSFGTNRTMFEHSVLMFHSIFWSVTDQTVYDMKSSAMFTDDFYKILLGDIIENCSLTISSEEFYDKCRHDWWLNASTARRLGFATNIHV